MNFDDYEWQAVNEGDWRLGRKARGIVRNPIAWVYFVKKLDREGFVVGLWRWRLYSGDNEKYGEAEELYEAIDEIEKIIGMDQIEAGDDTMRTCNQLAKTFYQMLGYKPGEFFLAYAGGDLHVQICWDMAVASFELFYGANVGLMLRAAGELATVKCSNPEE